MLLTLAANRVPLGPAHESSLQGNVLIESVKSNLVSTLDGHLGSLAGWDLLLARPLRLPVKLTDAFVSLKNGRLGSTGGEEVLVPL